MSARAAWSTMVSLLAVGALALVPGCEGRPGFGRDKHGEKLTGPALVELNLSRGVSERGASTLFGPMPGTSHSDLVAAIRELDPEETKGVFVRLGTTHVSLASANEIGRLLAGVREAGTPVYCHADDLDNSTLLLAARACSSIWISPAGGVDSVGIAFQLIFAKSLLEKLGVGVDFLQVGKYKGAQEPYTRDEPSPEARETMEGTLRELRAAWIEGIRAGREGHEGATAIAEMVEDGPHSAKQALAVGLVDAIGYADEARAAAKEKVGAERTVVGFGGSGGGQNDGFADLVRALSGGDAQGAPHIAVVRAVGAITMGGGGGGLGGSDGITEAGLGKVIADLTEDDAVKAVVLRIDSPGGSALASDLLWHKLMKLRKKKPLVVSVGGMAASGGYYLSCTGDRIFAEPTSIVGSIGVVGGKFALHGPLASIGVNTVTITAAPDEKRAARAAYMSPFDRWDDATRDKVRAGMEEIYDTFLARAAEGRGLDKDVIAAAAEGRIFGGQGALDHRLIDELGGLDEAIRWAQDKSGLGKDGKVRVHGETSGFLEMLGGDEEAHAALEAKARERIDPWASLTDKLPEETRTWIFAASPLGSGESIVATTPFVLRLQ